MKLASGLSEVTVETIVTIDFETYYESKGYTLSKMGPIEYIRHELFDPYMVGIKINEYPVKVFTGKEVGKALELLELHKPDRAMLGHNSHGFDALILSEHFGIHPANIYDTMSMARWIGYNKFTTLYHADLTQLFGTGVKKPGTVVSNGKKWPDGFTSEERKYMEDYCADDVEQCYANYKCMLAHVPEEAMEFASLSARMASDPVFWVDKKILEDYVALLEQQRTDAYNELCEIFVLNSEEDFIRAIRSPVVFPLMLERLGVAPPVKFSPAKTMTAVKKALENGLPGGEDANAQYSYALGKKDLEFTALLSHPDERVRLLVQTRLEQNSSIESSKARRLLAMASADKPMPVMLSTWGAHTSRYTAGNDGASDRVQMQNLSKRNKDKIALRRAIKASHGQKIVAVDSSQIEARVLAYLAGEQWLLDAFRAGDDPYSMMAEKIFGPPWKEIRAGAKAGDKRFGLYRHIGKTCVLSGGYGVSKEKFSDTLLRAKQETGLDARLDEDITLHHVKAHDVHAQYRAAVPNIVNFWRVCGNVIAAMYAGSSGSFSGPQGASITYGNASPPYMDKKTPYVELPSGYRLWYPEMGVRVGKKGFNEYTYMRRGKGKTTLECSLYGARLCENICQSFSFQILQYQAMRMWTNWGIRVVTNNHDCWVAVVLDSEAVGVSDIMQGCMSTCPPWCSDLPIACEGDIGTDFTIA